MKKVIRFIAILIWRVFIPLCTISFVSAFGILPFLSFVSSDTIHVIFIISQLIISIPILFLYYRRAQKKGYLDDTFWYANTGYALITALLFTVTFVISQGSITKPIFSANYVTAYMFIGTFVFTSLFSNIYSAIIIIGVVLAASVLITTALSDKKKYLPHCLVVIGILLVINLVTYFNSANYKYQGHGFDYMNGYSSVDLSDYAPYSDSGKLVTLDHEAEFIIKNEADMPVLDGAEACYPVYSAIAKAVYKDIDKFQRGRWC